MTDSAGRGAMFMHDAPDDRELTWWSGIVSATVEDYATAIGCDCATIVKAVEEGDPEPLFDTAVPKGRRGKEEERPTAHELRSLAFSREEFEALREAVNEGGGPRSGTDTPRAVGENRFRRVNLSGVHTAH